MNNKKAKLIRRLALQQAKTMGFTDVGYEVVNVEKKSFKKLDGTLFLYETYTRINKLKSPRALFLHNKRSMSKNPLFKQMQRV